MNPNLLFVLNMVLTFGVPLILLTRPSRPGRRKPDDRRPRLPIPPPPGGGEPIRPALPACLIPSVDANAVARQAARTKVLEPA
jgi:hypothetical protein